MDYEGIYIVDSNEVSCNSNKIQNCAIGIAVIRSSANDSFCNLDNNIIFDSAKDIGGFAVGIWITQVSKVNITGNTISNYSYSSAYGILIREDTSDCSVTGNIIYDVDDGIVLDLNSDDNVITGNIVRDCNGTGILINNANCDRNVVTGNRSTNNTTANFTDSGTNTTDSGNDWN
jgi:hypothetical protein